MMTEEQFKVAMRAFYPNCWFTKISSWVDAHTKRDDDFNWHIGLLDLSYKNIYRYGNVILYTQDELLKFLKRGGANEV